MPRRNVPSILRPAFAVPDSWSPVRIRREVLLAIADLAQARTGLHYALVIDGKEVRGVETEGIGGEDFLRFLSGFDGTSYAEMVSDVPGSPDYDGMFANDPTMSLSGFCIVKADDHKDVNTIKLFWNPNRIIASLGMVAVYEGNLLGWIGVFRHDDQATFSAADRRILQDHVEIINRRIGLASKRADAQITNGEAVAVFSEEGTLRTKSTPLESWLAVCPYAPRLRDAVTRFASSGKTDDRLILGRRRVKLTRLDGDRQLAVNVRLTRAPYPRVPVGLRLTPALRKVADLASLGATVPEIARSLEKSPETVRVQLRDIYQRLGLASRTELVRLLGCQPAL